MSLLRLVDAAIAPASTTTTLFDHVDLAINAGDRLALIGPNGSGKSTLLAALAGRQQLASGRREATADLRVACADRGRRPPTQRVELELLAHRPLALAALTELRAAERDGDDPMRLAAAIDRWAELDGWQLEARLARVLDGVGLAAAGVDGARPLATLSGGQRQRVELAALLVADAHVLLLDEPTDDLDERAVDWVERELLALDAAIVIASHDRALLESWPRRIAAIDTHAKRLRVGSGPLAQFEDTERARRETAEREHLASERRHAAAERAAAERTARATAMLRVDYSDGRRTIGQKAHFRGKAGALAKGARVLRERDERQRVERPWRDRRVGTIRVQPSPNSTRSGGVVLNAGPHLRIGHGDLPCCAPIELVVERGERVAIVGDNGAGKSTLLDTIAGDLTPISGHVALGATTIARLEQRVPEPLRQLTPLEVVERRVEPPRRDDARLMLGSLLVRGRDLQRPVEALSEGSRRKVLLACLLASGADLLLLDEPANHLDLASRDALAEALQHAPSAMLFTSHDRALRELVATRQLRLAPRT